MCTIKPKATFILKKTGIVSQQRTYTKIIKTSPSIQKKSGKRQQIAYEANRKQISIQ